ncbi:MAG: hypothetical protein PSX37_08910 [bacterium]|nr:hypothetical protein [bacterium]
MSNTRKATNPAAAAEIESPAHAEVVEVGPLSVEYMGHTFTWSRDQLDWPIGARRAMARGDDIEGTALLLGDQWVAANADAWNGHQLQELLQRMIDVTAATGESSGN